LEPKEAKFCINIKFWQKLINIIYNTKAGELLDRLEAIRVLKELIASTGCDSNFVALMPPNAHNFLSKGYQIHIKMMTNTTQREIIDSILKKNGLALKDKGETLVIYKPIQMQKENSI
jgi:hypothetical protein